MTFSGFSPAEDPVSRARPYRHLFIDFFDGLFDLAVNLIDNIALIGADVLVVVVFSGDDALSAVDSFHSTSLDTSVHSFLDAVD